MPELKIEVNNLEVSYRDGRNSFPALRAISFSVEAGEFVSVVGDSGCGKSTLLGVLGGLRPWQGGEVKIGGAPLRGPGLDRAMVFQHYSLFPWMSARGNVAFGIRAADKKMPKAEVRKKADRFLEKVGLENYAQKFPAHLSGGMRQRVAIARALALDADILLMDEPFGAVDARNRAILQDLLLALWEGNWDESGIVNPEGGEAPRKKTVVFVTHDIDEAILLSDRIIVFQGSPGRICRDFRLPFPRPRKNLSRKDAEEIEKLRAELLSLFFDDPGSGI
jgi:NitT/TauT family transport system ATP-binding protein